MENVNLDELREQATPINISSFHHEPNNPLYGYGILFGSATLRPPAQVTMELFSPIVPQNVAQPFYERVWEPWVGTPSPGEQPISQIFNNSVTGTIVGLQGTASGRVYRYEDFRRVVLGVEANPQAQARWGRLIQTFTAPAVPAPGGRVRGRADGSGAARRLSSGAGTFWLELSDLTKRCSFLYTCAAVSPLITEGRRLDALPG